MGVFSNFQWAFDASQRKLWWKYYGAIGVPFTLLLVAALVILYIVRWRPSRVYGLCGSIQWVTSVRKLWLTSAVAFLLFAAPFVALLIWGLVVAVNINPPLIGVSMLTAWLAALLCAAVIVNWWSRGFSLAPSSLQLNVVKWTGFVCLFLLVGFEFAFLYNGNHLVPCSTTSCTYVYSFVGSSWIWLGNNMILVSLAIYTMTTAQQSRISGRGLLMEFLRRRCSGVTSAVATSPTQATVQLVDKHIPYDKEYSYWFGSARVQAGILYAASVAVLIIYMILNLVLSSNAADSGRYLGFTTAGTVVVLDLCMWLMHRSSLIISIGPTLFFLTASRAVLIAFGAKYWMLGTSCVFLVFGLYLANVVAWRWVADLEWGVSVNRQISSSSGTGEESASLRHRTVVFVKDLIQRPGFALALLTTAFAIFVLAVEVNDSPNLPRALVPGFNDHQPQYSYAIGSIGIVLLYTAVAVGLRYRHCNGGKLDKYSLASFAVGEAIVLGFGFALFGVTVSYVVLATILFLPFLVVAMVVLYSTWVKDDFEWFVPGGFWLPWARSPTPDPAAAPAVAAPDVDKRKRNTMMLALLVLACLCFIAFALLSSVGFQHAWVGWVIAGGVFVAITTLLAAIEWFNTLHLTKSIIVTVLLAVVVHIGMHIALIAGYKSSDDSKKRLGAVFSLFLCPSLAMACVALYKFWDDKWKVTKFVAASLAFSAVILLGFVLASIFVFDNSGAGGAAFGTLLFVGFVVTMLVKWASSNFSLPRRWQLFAGCCVAAFFIAAVVIGSVRLHQGYYTGGLLWVSCGYLTIVVSLFLVGFSRMRVFTELSTASTPGGSAPRSRLYYTSGTLFPVLLFDAFTGQLSFANDGPALVVLSLVLSWCWASAAAVFITPTYIGIAIFVLIKVAVVQFVLHFTCKNVRQLHEAVTTLRRTQQFDAILIGAAETARKTIDNAGAVVSSDIIHSGTTPVPLQRHDTEPLFDGAKLCTLAFRKDIIYCRIVALEKEVSRIMAAYRFASGSPDGGANDVLQAVPPRLRDDAVTLSGDEPVSRCFARYRSMGPSEQVPAGAHVVARPDVLSVPDLEKWMGGDFSGLGDSMVRLRHLLQELRWLDGMARKAARDAAWVETSLVHGLLAAAQVDAIAQFAQWSNFLQWCASDKTSVKEALQAHGMTILGNLFQELKQVSGKSLRSRKYLTSMEELVKRWKVLFNPAEADRLARGLTQVFDLYKVDSIRADELQRKRQAEEEAAARRRLEEEVKRRQEALRRAAEEENLRQMQQMDEQQRRAKFEEEARLIREAAEAERRRVEEERQRRAQEAQQDAKRRAEREAAEAERRRQEIEEQMRKQAAIAAMMQAQQAEAARVAELKRQQEEQARLLEELQRREAAARAERERLDKLKRDQEAARAAEAERQRQAELQRIQREEEERHQRLLEQQRRLAQMPQEVKVSEVRPVIVAPPGPPPPAPSLGGVLDLALQTRADASAEVQRLVDDAMGVRKKKFRDDTFVGDEAVGAIQNADGPPAKWERASAICKQPCVYDSFSSDDIVQGILGDCYLLSALSVMAAKPGLLERIIVTKELNPAGVLCVQLFKNGKWTPMLMDDRFPVAPDAYYDYEANVTYAGRYDAARQKYCSPQFATSRNHNELWVMMIEKAYAKFHGSYAAIEGGLVNIALVDFTGGSSELIKLDDAVAQQNIKSGQTWAKILRLAEAGHLLGAGSNAGSDRDVSPQGIVQGHAYAILKAVEDSDTHGTHCLLKLRNPWARQEWTGAWCDTDARWTKRMRQKLDYVPNTEEDGVFWMSFDDFVLNFRNVYVCRLFKTVSEGGTWYKYTASGAWSLAEGTAGGCPNEASCVNNPQYYVRVEARCTVFLSLSQRESDRPTPPIGFKLLKKKGKRVRNVFQGEQVMGGAYVPTREVSDEATLDPELYTLFVSTFASGVQNAFTVTVYTDRPLADVNPDGTLRRIGTDVPAA